MAALGATLKLRLDKSGVDSGLDAVQGQAMRVKDNFLRAAEAFKIGGAIANKALGPLKDLMGEIARSAAEQSEEIGKITKSWEGLKDAVAGGIAEGVDRGLAQSGRSGALDDFAASVAQKLRNAFAATSSFITSGGRGPAAEPFKEAFVPAAVEYAKKFPTGVGMQSSLLKLGDVAGGRLEETRLQERIAVEKEWVRTVGNNTEAFEKFTKAVLTGNGPAMNAPSDPSVFGNVGRGSPILQPANPVRP